MLTSLTSILFLKFSIFLPYIELFINLNNAFPSLSPFFSFPILLCMLNLINGFNHWINWILKTRCLFLLLILTLNKVVSCHKEANSFFIKNSWAPIFLILPIETLEKSEMIYWYLDNISLLNFILSGDKG